MTAPRQGSNLLNTPFKSHLVKNRPGGVPEEVGRVRAAFVGVAAIVVEEFDAPIQADVDNLVLSQASSATKVTITGAGFTGDIGPGPVKLAYPANLEVTCSDHVATWTGHITVKGLDVNGKPITDTINLVNNATTAGVKAFQTISEIDIPAQVDALGTLSIGTGSLLGLAYPVMARTGATTSLPPFREYVNHATPTAGVIDATNNTYAPNTPPDGSTKYAVYYEADMTGT